MCHTSSVDYSASFETEKHSFYITGSSAQKPEINAFYIYGSAQVDFIPLDILSEFPNLNGLILYACDLPTLKSDLFKAELNKIQYLWLYKNKIESIEPQAFKFLTKLKWIGLNINKLQTLPYQIFKDNPDLIYISFEGNKINSIHPNFFDGLQKLKLIDFTENEGCINVEIGCETCLITQSEIRGKLQGCFDNCSNGTTCYTSYLAHEASQTTEIPQTTTEKPIESNSNEHEGVTKIENNKLEEISQNLTKGLEQISQDNKMAIEGVEDRLFNITNELKNSVENMPKVIEETIEANNKLTQEAVEKMLKETVAEMKTCCAANQVQPINGPNDQLAELFAVQLELMKVKMENLEFKCAKKEEALGAEIKSLKQEIDGKEDLESQLKELKLELELMVQKKLDTLADRLENNGG